MEQAFTIQLDDRIFTFKIEPLKDGGFGFLLLLAPSEYTSFSNLTDSERDAFFRKAFKKASELTGIGPA